MDRVPRADQAAGKLFCITKLNQAGAERLPGAGASAGTVDRNSTSTDTAGRGGAWALEARRGRSRGKTSPGTAAPNAAKRMVTASRTCQVCTGVPAPVSKSSVITPSRAIAMSR